jgi:hypothetical protein
MPTLFCLKINTTRKFNPAISPSFPLSSLTNHSQKFLEMIISTHFSIIFSIFIFICGHYGHLQDYNDSCYNQSGAKWNEKCDSSYIFYIKLHLSPVVIPLIALLFLKYPLMLLFMLSCDTGCHLILTLLFLLTYVFSF